MRLLPHRLLLGTTLLALATAAPLVAQRALVLSQLSTHAQLYEVDLQTAQVTPLARFPGDTDRALTLVHDFASDDVIVALARGKSTTVFTRLSYAGAQLVRSRPLGSVTGIATDMILADRSAIYASVEGPDGLVRCERVGPQPKLTVPARAPLAMFGYGPTMGYVWLLEGQRGTMTPQLRQVILPGGQTQYQPAPWKAMSSRITGMVELPTGAIRFLLTDDQGQLLLSTGFGDPVVLQMNPKLPAGGTVALRSYGAFNSYALGGQAHPYIHSVTGYSSPGTWTRVAGPISGDPVDFVLLPPLQPQLETISYGCRRGRAVPFELSASGAPKLGSPSFVLLGDRSATPQQLGLLTMGLLGPQEIALPLPGGCTLLSTLDLILPASGDAQGRYALPFPIPNDPSLSNLRLPMQWLVPSLTPALEIEVSSAAWMRIAP
jgi:hypothetical protein